LALSTANLEFAWNSPFVTAYVIIALMCFVLAPGKDKDKDKDKWFKAPDDFNANFF
jgi:hypothetical protein